MPENPATQIAIPELTAVAVEAAAMDEQFVYDQIAPVVEVKRSQFKYALWDKTFLKEIDRTERAIGGPANEASKIGRTFVTGSTRPQALKTDIADEILADAYDPQVFKNRKIQALVRKIRVGIEHNVKTLLDAATGSFTNAAVAKWDVVTNTTIESDVLAGKKTMREARGIDPTHIIMGRTVAEAVLGNNRIRELIKYNPNDLLSRYVLPPTLFGLIPLVPGLLVDAANPGAAASIGPLWDDAAGTVYLVYVDKNSTADTLTAIIQFRNTATSQPFAVTSWRDPDLSRRTDWFSCEVAQTELTVSNEAIYKITATRT